MEARRRQTSMAMTQLASQRQDEPADDADEDLSHYHDDIRESDAKLQEALRQVLPPHLAMHGMLHAAHACLSLQPTCVSYIVMSMLA